MNKRILLVGLVVLLLALLLAGIAGAQTSPGYSLSWYVLAGGGGRSAAAHYAMNSTVGQWATGLSSSAGHGMQSGYWQNWPDYSVFLPVMMKGA